MAELPGDDHAFFVDPEPVTPEVERFLRSIWDRGEWDTIESDRVRRYERKLWMRDLVMAVAYPPVDH